MNKRVVLGVLVAGGLGIGLFAAVERAMRGAGHQVIRPPQSEPETPVEMVTVPEKAKPAPRTPAARPGGTVAVSPGESPWGDVVRWEEPRPAKAAVVPPAKPARPAKPAIQVDRIAVCLAVKDRNPAGETGRVPADVGKVFAWFKVTGAQGKKVRPVWTVNGKTYPGTWLTIGSNSYRTWATKRVDASMKGAAKVELQDEKGRTIASKNFEVVAR